MGFLLRIYFFGLIAFVPHSERGEITSMTALLVNARQGFHTSDHHAFPAHHPVLLIRSGSCKGACIEQLQEVANLVVVPSPGGPVDPAGLKQQLKEALQAGGTWVLDSEQITIQTSPNASARGQKIQCLSGRRRSSARDGAQKAPVPVDPREAEDFSWIADMKKIFPTAAAVDPDCLAPHPQKGLITARLELRQGDLRTYRLASFEGNVHKFVFRSLTEALSKIPYSQALADAMVVDIPVAGCEAVVTAERFDGSGSRSMKIAPQQCGKDELVEMVLLNLPDRSPQTTVASHSDEDPQGVATHFEMFYALSKTPPPPEDRPVPEITGELVSSERVDAVPTPLINFLSFPRAGTFSRPICTQAVFSESPDA
jgi:hypothetical protein